MAEVQSVRQLPPEFIEAAGKTYLSDLQKAVGDFKTTDLSGIMGRQFVAGPGALTTQAEQLATGLGSFQPFLTEAAAAETAAKGLVSPTAFCKSSKYVLLAASINSGGNCLTDCTSAIKLFLLFQGLSSYYTFVELPC